MKVLSVIAINVISAKIILYLIIHLGVTLLVEYIVLGSLSYSNPNLIYFISRKNSGDQYEGSVTDFQASFRIHKNYVKTKKGSCATANHFNNRWWDRSNPHIVLQVHFIESVQSDVNLEGKLWERQCQLFTNTHGINGVSDLYSSKRKGCRKN